MKNECMYPGFCWMKCFMLFKGSELGPDLNGFTSQAMKEPWRGDFTLTMNDLQESAPIKTQHSPQRWLHILRAAPNAYFPHCRLFQGNLVLSQWKKTQSQSTVDLH